jgi:uncharacterized membrane protein
VIQALRRDLPAIVIVVAMFALAAWAWPQAPASLPVHWGIDGTPDRWGGRVEGLLLMPALAAGILALTALLPRVDPGRANYAQFAGTFTFVRFVTVAFLGVMYAVSVASALGADVELGRVVPALTGGLLLALGAVLGKVRPNWFVGIRTPWTLSSKRAWTRTHRLGGWTTMASGAAVLIAALVSPAAAYVTLLVASVANVTACALYSWLVWRDDPDRLPPAGTLPG